MVSRDKWTAETILPIFNEKPLTKTEIRAILGLGFGQVERILAKIVKTKKVYRKQVNGLTYYGTEVNYFPPKFPLIEVKWEPKPRKPKVLIIEPKPIVEVKDVLMEINIDTINQLPIMERRNLIRAHQENMKRQRLQDRKEVHRIASRIANMKLRKEHPEITRGYVKRHYQKHKKEITAYLRARRDYIKENEPEKYAKLLEEGRIYGKKRLEKLKLNPEKYKAFREKDNKGHMERRRLKNGK